MSTEEMTVRGNNFEKRGNTQKKWLESLKQFHVNRTVQVSRLPSDVSEEDIQELLKFLDIKKIEINELRHSAYVTLTRPESFDPLLLCHDVPTDFKGHQITIKYDSVDNFLCISNLPVDYTEDLFKELVQKFGPVDRCFLIYDHITDQSKGYGLVQYCSRAVASQARNLLHGKEVSTSTLYCDWLDHKLVIYEDLYSRCIYVDNLPANYSDLGSFRKIFSIVVRPLYCQLAHKIEKATVFGLVEYTTSKDVALTCDKLNNYKLEDNFIRIFLTIPSVPAVKLYHKLVFETSVKKKSSKGLFPAPPNPISLLPNVPLSPVWNQFGQSNGFLLNSPLLFSGSQLPLLPSLQPASVTYAAENYDNLLRSPFNSLFAPKKLSFCNETSFPGNQLENREHYRQQVIKSAIGQGRPTVKPLMPHQQCNIMNVNSNAENLLSPRQNNPLEVLKNIFISSSPKQNFVHGLSFSSSTPVKYNQSVTSQHLFSYSSSALRQTADWPVSPNMLASYTDGALRLNSPCREITNNEWRTPRQKRKLHHLLPSPEQSPENNYIGQHSQGIGGHYADSYFSAKKTRR